MADILERKSILLGVCGGIAAYKAAALASRLAQGGAEVEVALTPSAGKFVSPLTFASLTRRRTHDSLWEEDRKPGHIALAERADLIVVAPATANTLAKVANGLADNLLTSVILAARKPVLLAPAMNSGMWEAPATRRNLETLRADGRRLVGPGQGHLACGSSGTGRMAEPDEIISAIRAWLEELDAKRIC